MVRPALTFVPTLGLLHRHLCVPPQQPLQKLSGLARPLAELWIASVRCRPVEELLRTPTLGKFSEVIEGELLRSRTGPLAEDGIALPILGPVNELPRPRAARVRDGVCPRRRDHERVHRDNGQEAGEKDDDDDSRRHFGADAVAGVSPD